MKRLQVGILPFPRQVVRVTQDDRESLRVTLVDSEKPPEDTPSLEDVEELRNGSARQWASFLKRYGVPEREESWLLRTDDLSRIRELRDLRLDLPENVVFVEEYRVPLFDLHAYGSMARRLHLSERALTEGDLKAFWKAMGPGGIDRKPEELTSIAQQNIGLALQRALGSLKPFVDLSVRRGTTDAWALYSPGWWPRLVLEAFIHRNRFSTPVVCVAEGCGCLVPAYRQRGRYAGDLAGEHYCSESCRQRMKKRRYRMEH